MTVSTLMSIFQFVIAAWMIISAWGDSCRPLASAPADLVFTPDDQFPAKSSNGTRPNQQSVLTVRSASQPKKRFRVTIGFNEPLFEEVIGRMSKKPYTILYEVDATDAEMAKQTALTEFERDARESSAHWERKIVAVSVAEQLGVSPERV